MEAQPVVTVVEGKLRGKILKSVRDDSSYYSFQGIPYAQPPVGPLRFKAPKPVLPWTGIRDALQEGSTAPSVVMGTTQFLESSSEDCLYLNVYTPKIPEGGSKPNKPVLFWVHGGAFKDGSGSSDIFGPDYLITKEVVVVTINYRLGALGFLSLQNKECPGNFGLKDQVEALRWVQRNISAFGGNPENVTVFGESAGGASVQFLMLSPLTKGLFHRAISQSGSVLNPWALTKCPVESARVLGELCGLKTTDDQKLLSFLANVSPKELVTQASGVSAKVNVTSFYMTLSFLPVVEPEGPEAFLSRPPEDLIREGLVHDVPYIVGVNTLEGLIVVNPAKGGLAPLNTNEELARLLPGFNNFKNDENLVNSLVDQIRSFYFPNGFDEKKFVDALSASIFLYGNYKFMEILGKNQNRKSKIFFYLFSHESSISLLKKIFGFSDWKGTMHGDELSFLFYHNLFPHKIEPGSSDDRIIEQLTTLWTNFAATGNPSTSKDNPWPAYTTAEKQYLDINLAPQVRKGLNDAEMKFWASIFDKINCS